MPFKVYTTADGTQIHKYEKAPPATAATRKPVLTNTTTSLAEGMFDKTKAVNIKEALKAKKAAAAAAKEPKEPTDGFVVSNHITDELREMIERELTSGAWHMTEIPEEERDDYINENFNELVDDLGGGYGVFDDVVDELVSRLGYSPETMVEGMKFLRDESGYTMFDDYIEKHSADENELDKQLQEEVKTGFKDPAKVKAFSDALNIAITEGKEKQMNKNKGIAEIQATITAPKGTKAQLIEMIEEMVTDPVDRLKLDMKRKSKGDLETLYIKMKAIHDWHKKNRPGEGIDYI
jgi:hypothetical protein